MQRATTLCLLLLCMSAGCKRDSFVMPWSPAARFNTREWMLARERGAVTVTGPKQAALLWQFKEPDLSIDSVLPMPDGSIFLCGHKTKVDHKRLKALEKLDTAKLTTKQLKKYLDETWDLVWKQDGGNEGVIIKLDRLGKELKRLNLPERADKKGWSSFSFAGYPSRRGFVVSESKRVYQEKMKGIHKLWSTPFNKMDDIKEEDLSMVGSRTATIAAWDLDLNPIWSKDYPDTDIAMLYGVAVDAQGNVVLDCQTIGKQLGELKTSIRWLNHGGKEISKYEEQIPDLVKAGYDRHTFAESKDGYLFARQDDELLSFTARQLYKKEVHLGRDVDQQPMPLLDWGYLIRVSTGKLTGNYDADRKIKSGKYQLRRLDSSGADVGEVRLDGWEESNGDLSLGSDGSYYFVTIESKKPGEKDRVFGKMRDDIKKDFSAGAFKRWREGRDDDSRPLRLPWDAVVSLHHLSAIGSKVWKYKYELPVTNLGPSVGNTIIDKDGHSYFLVEDKLLGVGSDGKQLFKVDLKPLDAGQGVILYSDNFQLTPNGDLLMTSDGKLLVFGDK